MSARSVVGVVAAREFRWLFGMRMARGVVGQSRRSAVVVLWTWQFEGQRWERASKVEGEKRSTSVEEVLVVRGGDVGCRMGMENPGSFVRIR